MKKDNLSIGNLVDRAASKTPSFWKKMQKYALVLGAVGTGILTCGIALPAIVTVVATAAVTVSGTVITVAQLTKEDSAAKTADDSAGPAK